VKDLLLTTKKYKFTGGLLFGVIVTPTEIYIIEVLGILSDY